MKKLLLTGFEPFLNYPINPTEEIVQALDGAVIGDYMVCSKLLPVEFRLSGDRIIEYIQDILPDAVISLGLAAGRSQITLERIGINCADGEKDNTGYKPLGERIVADGADGMFTSLPLNQMLEGLIEAGYPASISNSAGTYVCNQVMYRVLHHLQETKQSKQAGFIHVPANHSLALHMGKIPSWSQQDLQEAVQVLINHLN
ncbi:pyroglutamyl-peptidase I [Peribacillus sp. FSL H8-0477]|uniref:pyroglutamyl-peptidase I n=1 Tax=Peribacillus sp. FSL H8-0477 TaxID=2921388 RepID=UPI0030FA2989